MSNKIHVPLVDNELKIVFPELCVCCAAERETESTLVLSKLITRRRKQEPITVKFKVPHCARCARTTKSVFLAGCIPFGLGFLLVGAGVFVGVAFFAMARGFDELGKPVNANSLLIGAAAGFFAGLFGAFLFEVIARVILLPFLGKGLLATPLFALQLLRDSQYIAGLTARLNGDASQVEFNFSNSEVAQRFRSLNTNLA